MSRLARSEPTTVIISTQSALESWLSAITPGLNSVALRVRVMDAAAIDTAEGLGSDPSRKTSSRGQLANDASNSHYFLQRKEVTHIAFAVLSSKSPGPSRRSQRSLLPLSSTFSNCYSMGMNSARRLQPLLACKSNTSARLCRRYFKIQMS